MESFIEKLVTIVGHAYVLRENLDAYTIDWRKKYAGKALAVAKPKTTAQVSAIVCLCCEYGVSIVPQGGNTGLVGGGVPDETGTQLIVNVSRMNAIRNIDLINNTLTVEAGCVLQTIQELADNNDRLFALALAAQGSCEIGGNISTNAGGVQVVRYGNTRDSVLGLEVVLPDGRVFDGLQGLRKDNTGYDLKQLFIGAEGTLGIVTAAVLKLHPKPKANVTAWVALQSPSKAISLLNRVKSNHAESLTAFELVSRFSHELVLRHFPRFREPLDQAYPWYVLLELNDSSSTEKLQAALELTFINAVESQTIDDCVIAKNSQEAIDLWALRENITEAQVHDGKNIKHDVSLPISNIAQFIDAADNALTERFPGVRPVNFGHLGDGNLHYNIARPLADYTEASWLEQWQTVNHIVHSLVAQFSGSISAEHGIGQLKRDEIKDYKSAVALDLMRKIKASIDPQGIMNPGKVI